MTVGRATSVKRTKTIIYFFASGMGNIVNVACSMLAVRKTTLILSHMCSFQPIDKWSSDNNIIVQKGL